MQLCRIRARSEATTSPQCFPIPVVYKTITEVKPQTVAAYTISIGPRVVMATAATGSVIVRVGKSEDAPANAKLLLKVDGGDVTSARAVNDAGATVPMVSKGGGYELGAAASVSFELENLHPTVAVVITGTGAEKPDRFELRVENLQPPSPAKP